MTCTTPQIPPSKVTDVDKFSKVFAEQMFNFVKALHLPSALDPSVLSFKSNSGGYYVEELEDPKIIQSFVENSLKNAIRGQPSIKVDTSKIIKDLCDIVNVFVGGAKTTPNFSGFTSPSYRGEYAEQNVIYKVLLAIHTANATELYESGPKRVLELAYLAFLTVQKVD